MDDQATRAAVPASITVRLSPRQLRFTRMALDTAHTLYGNTPAAAVRRQLLRSLPRRLSQHNTNAMLALTPRAWRMLQVVLLVAGGRAWDARDKRTFNALAYTVYTASANAAKGGAK